MGEDMARTRAWLVAMGKQGEDRVWRGAEKALACFDYMVAEIERLKLPRFGEAGYRPAAPLLHAYKPHRKYPWFCGICGYPPHEELKHFPCDASVSENAATGARAEMEGE